MEINILQIIFQIVNFGVVFGAISYLLYHPIIKILDDRRKKTEETLALNEVALREKEELESQKKKVKTQAEKETAKLLEVARDEAKQLKTKLSADLKAEISDLRQKEIVKLAQEKKGQEADMEKHVTKLSVAIAEKVLGESIDEKKHKDLITDAIKGLAKSL